MIPRPFLRDDSNAGECVGQTGETCTMSLDACPDLLQKHLTGYAFVQGVMMDSIVTPSSQPRPIDLESTDELPRQDWVSEEDADTAPDTIPSPPPEAEVGMGGVTIPAPPPLGELRELRE